MTENISTMICKICGIEPLNDETAYFTGRSGNLPDFEKPENFVKLLELKILTGCTLWGYLSLKNLFMSKRTVFLKALYLMLSGEIKILDQNTTNSIKLAIRGENWNYD